MTLAVPFQTINCGLAGLAAFPCFLPLCFSVPYNVDRTEKRDVMNANMIAYLPEYRFFQRNAFLCFAVFFVPPKLLGAHQRRFVQWQLRRMVLRNISETRAAYAESR